MRGTLGHYRRKICQIPQYTVSKLDVILKPLHCTLSLEQITRKQKLRFGNVRFRQNKEKARKTLEDLKEDFLSRPKRQKNRIPQIWRIPQYRNSRLKLPKYRKKNYPTPQYRKPRCPPLLWNIVDTQLGTNKTEV